MPRLSVTIITRDEAGNIGRALESVSWADDVIVVDSGSTDDTVSIARRHTDRVFVREWAGYSAQKNHAAGLAHHDWILSLDADEKVTGALASEIRATLDAGPPASGFRIPRVTWHLGRWIRSTDWYPDFQIRLYDRRVARFIERPVHESVGVDGPVATLRHEIEHYAYRDLAHHVATLQRYTDLAARHLHEEGRRTSLAGLAVHPPLAFVRNYLVRGGIRDGVPGLIVSTMNAFYVYLKLAKLWELQNGESRRHRTG